MRKLFSAAVILMLIAALFVSCNSAGPVSNDAVASLSFDEAGITKSLSATTAGLYEAKDLFWFYTAVKTDAGPQTGITSGGNTHIMADAKPVCADTQTPANSGGQGLSGYVVSPFSIGGWTFGLYGYTKADKTATGGQLVYTTTNFKAATVAASMVSKVKVDVDTVQTNGTGTLKINNISAEAGDPSFAYKIDSGDWQSDADVTTTAGYSASVASGSHKVYVKAVYGSGSTLSELEGSIEIVVYNGFITTVSGTIDDLTGGVEFDDPDEPDPSSTNRYRVIYNPNNANSGDVPVDDASYAANAEVTVLAKPANLTKVGFIFTGWNTSADGNGTAYAGDGTAKFNIGSANVTLYAIWAKAYKVAYDANGATGGTVPSDSNEYKTGDNVPLGSFAGLVKTDSFVCNGWSTSADGEKIDGTTVEMGSSDLKLYAHWVSSICSVSFDMQGHGTQIETLTNVGYGSIIAAPTEPVEGEYVFGGWFKEAECENAWNFDSDAVTGDITLYAKWTINCYNVTFNMQNHGNAVAAQSIPYDGYAALPAAPEAAGFTFAGWFKEAGCTNAWNFDVDKVTVNVVLYAKWTYTISYNGNCATGGSVPSSLTLVAGKNVTVAGSDLSKTNHNFAWWNTKADGTGTNYAPGAVVTGGLDGDTVLYAKWENPNNFVKFTGSEAFALSATPHWISVSGKTGTVEYSNDGTTWTAWNGSSAASSSGAAGNVLYLRGKDISAWSKYADVWDANGDSTILSFTKSVNVSGNIMALLNYESPSVTLTSENDNCFTNLFRGASVVDASGLILPATTLSFGCYKSMFMNSGVVTAPRVLPAVTLASQCYCEMFRGCGSLVNAPEIKATSYAATRSYKDYLGTANYNAFISGYSHTSSGSSNVGEEVRGCCEEMFTNCKKLRSLVFHFSSIDEGATSWWLYDVGANGSAICFSSYVNFETTNRSVHNLPSDWGFTWMT